MGISSVGINSGVLNSELIDKLTAAERKPVEARLDIKKDEYDSKLSAYGQIKTALSDLRIEARKLSKASSFSKLSATSTNSVVSGAATKASAKGTYTVEVSNIAQAHVIATDSFATTSDVIGTGTLTLAAGGKTANITIDATNNTLAGIAAAVNAQADLPVTASVINTGSGYRLLFTSDSTGAGNAITATVTADGDGNDANDAGLSQLSFNTTNSFMAETNAALDASFNFNGVAVTRSSNTVTDLVDGLTLTLSGNNVGSPATVKVGLDTKTMSDNVSKFVDKYNELQKLYRELTAYNPDTGEGSVLTGDATLRSIFNQARSSMHSMLVGLAGQEVRSLADIGVSTDADTGEITFDGDAFVAAVTAYGDDAEALFSTQGRTSDSQISFSSNTSTAKAGKYDITVTTLATQGSLVSAAAIADPNNVVIDADNDTFSLSVDGTASGTITLTQGTYTAADLAQLIEDQINADTTLAGAKKTVSVAYDSGTNQFTIKSDAFGSASKVAITAVDTNTTAQLGFSVASGTDGVDVAGTIDGVAATGVGQYLTASDDSDAAGIKIQVSGGAIGVRGSVTLIRGIADQMVSRINEFLSADGGAITARQEGLQKSLDDIATEREELDDHIASLQARLQKQFTAADTLIGGLNNTADFLTNFFKSMSGSSDS
jgi:flagellar hook-associated protein 2